MKMMNRNSVENCCDLTDREFDLLKLEVQLQEKRILHLENLQYRLRQFSIILWVAMIGVGLRITVQGTYSPQYSNLLFIGISSFVPILFLFMDALYAAYAQAFRSRKNEIIDFFNKREYELPVTLIEAYRKEASDSKERFKFPIFDFHGAITLGKDPQTIYRGNIFVKLTRETRIFFYGFQILGSSVILSHLLVVQEQSAWYYLLVLGHSFMICMLYVIRHRKKRIISKNAKRGYQRKLDERADKHNL